MENITKMELELAELESKHTAEMIKQNNKNGVERSYMTADNIQIKIRDLREKIRVAKSKK
jgi:hypothetical protein